MTLDSMCQNFKKRPSLNALEAISTFISKDFGKTKLYNNQWHLSLAYKKFD